MNMDQRETYSDGKTEVLEKRSTGRKVAGSIPDGGLLRFFIDLNLPATLWP
jgi:hypothetical protein